MEDIKTKQLIDKMSQEDCARLQRFGKSDDSRLQGDNYKYFQEHFNKLGGMTPEIYKCIGW